MTNDIDLNRVRLAPRGFAVRSGIALGLVGLILAGAPAIAEARDKPKPDEAKAEEAADVEETGQKKALTLMISLRDQKIHVYRGEKMLDSSRISSGMRGYSTPAGVFSILQKNKWHRSNIYSGAPMPYMQRITWSGVALHAGVVPGYRASHGCIRLPTSFARKLWGMTDMGQHVVVAHGAAPVPVDIEHAKLFQPSEALKVTEAEDLSPWWSSRVSEDPKQARALAAEPAAKLIPVAVRSGEEPVEPNADGAAKKEEAAPASTSPLRMFITQRTGREKLLDAQRMLHDMGYLASEPDGLMGPDTVAAIKVFQVHKGMKEDGEFDDELIARIYKAADRGEPSSGHLYVRQDMKPVFDAPVDIKDPDKPLGTHLFVSSLYTPEDETVEWVAISPVEDSSASEALDRVEMSKEVRERVAALMQPGSSLLIADGGFSSETGAKGTDFIALIKRSKDAVAAAAADDEVEEAKPRQRPARRRVQRRQRHYAHEDGFFGGRRYYYDDRRYRQRRPSRPRGFLDPWAW